MTVSNPHVPLDSHGKETQKGDRFTQRQTQLVLFENGKEARDIPLSSGDSYLEEIEEFAHCVRTRDRPETDGHGALAALAFVRAAIESAQTGNQVKIRT